jgi:hypothetical protein
MVNCCINPACRCEFKLFSSGNLYAHERPVADTEFFWLCSECVSKVDLHLDTAGHVSTRSRGNDRRRPPHPDGDLRLVSRPILRVPWQHMTPAGEREPLAGVGFDRVPLHCEAA